jgi:DNA-binding LacI/PurR family transcriptional regulator
MTVAKPGSEDGRARRRPGSTDVARLAGVSQKTVSRVVNGEPYVKEEVRLRVQAAMRELGYRRNDAARALNSGRTQRIGVVCLGTALFGPATQLVAIERALRTTGYSVSIVNTLEGDTVADAIEHLLVQGVDGIILSEPIGRAATEHLLGLGHRTVWHVAGPHRWWAARERMAGWRQALADAGAPEPPVLEGDWLPASGYAAGQQLAADDDVTAIFVANDDMAIGVLRALTEAGRSVPEDVSIVGFDDIPTAAFLTPPLTTVPQDFDLHVARGIANLVKEIESPTGDRSPAPERPSLRLVIRHSTAAPPERHR